MPNRHASIPPVQSADKRVAQLCNMTKSAPQPTARLALAGNTEATHAPRTGKDIAPEDAKQRRGYSGMGQIPVNDAVQIVHDDGLA